ncbi:hypothetical protein ACTMU2_33560 [Cupriavidus basilensis]
MAAVFESHQDGCPAHRHQDADRTDSNLTLTGTGDLAHAGNLAALGSLTITTPGTFTNQGAYASKVTTTPGCVAGSTTCNGTNPHVDDLSWQQQNNTVGAGQSLTIEAANIRNLNGTLAAQGNVSLNAGSSGHQPERHHPVGQRRCVDHRADPGQQGHGSGDAAQGLRQPQSVVRRGLQCRGQLQGAATARPTKPWRPGLPPSSRARVT